MLFAVIKTNDDWCILQDIEFIRAHYAIEDFIYYNYHQREEHAHLFHFTVNPIFRHYTRHFLKVTTDLIYHIAEDEFAKCISGSNKNLMFLNLVFQNLSINHAVCLDKLYLLLLMYSDI